MRLQTESIANEAAIIANSVGGMKIGGAASIIGLLGQSWLIGLVGLIVAVLGLVINLWFSARRNTREHNEYIRKARRDDADEARREKEHLLKIEMHDETLKFKRRKTDIEDC